MDVLQIKKKSPKDMIVSKKRALSITLSLAHMETICSGLAAQRFGCGKLTAFFPLEIRPSPVETSDKDEQDRRPEHK
jgi:hypothetical protein